MSTLMALPAAAYGSGLWQRQCPGGGPATRATTRRPPPRAQALHWPASGRALSCEREPSAAPWAAPWAAQQRAFMTAAATTAAVAAAAELSSACLQSRTSHSPTSASSAHTNTECHQQSTRETPAAFTGHSDEGRRDGFTETCHGLILLALTFLLFFLFSFPPPFPAALENSAVWKAGNSSRRESIILPSLSSLFMLQHNIPLAFSWKSSPIRWFHPAFMFKNHKKTIKLKKGGTSIFFCCYNRSVERSTFRPQQTH